MIEIKYAEVSGDNVAKGTFEVEYKITHKLFSKSGRFMYIFNYDNTEATNRTAVKSKVRAIAKEALAEYKVQRQDAKNRAMIISIQTTNATRAEALSRRTDKLEEAEVFTTVAEQTEITNLVAEQQPTPAPQPTPVAGV